MAACVQNKVEEIQDSKPANSSSFTAKTQHGMSDARICSWWSRATKLLRLPPPELKAYGQMPPYCRERHIEQAYRPNPSSIRYCVESALHPTNETMNFWTHFLPMLFLLVRHYDFLRALDMDSDSLKFLIYPFLTYSVGCCVLLGCSSFAHMFNCVSPKVRHVCFCSDYGAISVYSVAGTIAYFYLVSPPQCHGFHADHSELYIPIAVAVSFVSHIACCYTRFPHVKARYLLRTVAYVMPFIIISSPALIRLMAYFTKSNLYGRISSTSHLTLIPVVGASELPEKSTLCNSEMFQTYFLHRSHGSHCNGSTSDINIAQSKPFPDIGTSNEAFCQLGEQSFPLNYSLHLIFFLIAAIFNVSRFPEKLFPGRFDVIGSSHQLFHIAIALGIIAQSFVVEDALLDAIARLSTDKVPIIFAGATVWSTLGVLTFVTLVLSIIVVIYGRTLDSKP